MSYSNIIFDMGGVLTDLNAARCVDAFREIGAPEVAHYVEHFITQDLFLDIELGTISPQQFCQQVRAIAHTDATDERIVWAWNELTSVIPDEKLQLIRDIHRHHRTFLLSNTNEMHWAKHEKDFRRGGHSVEECFDDVFLSCRMRMAKPGKEIFMKAIETAGIDPSDTLFIDDREENCRGAAEAGLNVLHDRSGKDWMALF